MNRTPVAHFNTRSHAEPLQKRLAEAGCQAEIHDELWLEKLWFVSRPVAGARIEVPVQQFERAHRLLLEWDAAERALRDAIRCPECKSLNVDYPQFTRKFLVPNLVMGMCAEMGLLEKDYYCMDCHYTWPKEGTRPSRARPHMAPYYFIEGVERSHSSKGLSHSG
jgi:hypothetical protein